MDQPDNFEFDLARLPYLARVPILRKLEHSSPDDLLNLFQVFPSEAFREPTEASKSTWLFEKIFPLLLRYLSQKNAFDCRLVCYRWKLAIDRALANSGVVESKFSPTAFKFATQLNGNCEQLLKEMEAHPSNPITFRTLALAHQVDRDHWNNVKRLLERHGTHVWKMIIYDFHCDGLHTILLLRDILQCTPNLRMLILFEHDENREPPLERNIPLTEEDRGSLTDFPIPEMSGLQCVLVNSDWMLCDALLPQCSSYLVWMILPPQFFGEYDSGTHGTFPCLTSLEVEVNSEAELHKLTHLESPLRTLEVKLKARIPLWVQMNVFHHFGQTLESIQIEVDRKWAQQERKTVWENLEVNCIGEACWDFPKLNVMRFPVMDRPRESLDWLAKVRPGPKQLEIWATIYLDLEKLNDVYNGRTNRLPWGEGIEPVPFFAAKMEGEMVQLHGFLNNLDASAVWEMLPRLEFVNVTTTGRVDNDLGHHYHSLHTRGCFKRPAKTEGMVQSQGWIH